MGRRKIEVRQPSIAANFRPRWIANDAEYRSNPSATIATGVSLLPFPLTIAPAHHRRHRSVTFLKRKGGLFKKAHELSVLCSVDVAVIIFGHNKKLYEYSSSEIQDIIGRFQYVGDGMQWIEGEKVY